MYMKSGRIYVFFVVVFLVFLNLDSVIEIISFSEPFYREQNKIHGNELILSEIAKTMK